MRAAPGRLSKRADDARAAGGAPRAGGRRSAGNGWLRARRLLVVRPDNIGDVLMAGPALRALRRALPRARLTLLASPAGAQAAPLLPWVDEVIARRVLWQDLGRLAFDPAREWALIERLRTGRHDGAVILTSFSQTPHPAAFTAWLAGIPLRAGASRERAGVLTDAVPSGPDAMHQVERNLALIRALGFDAPDDKMTLRIPPAARRRAAVLLASRGIGRHGRWLLLSPWASAPSRSYPPERSAEAARLAARDTGLRVVVTANARDAGRAAELAEEIGPAAVNVAGETGIAELAALIEGAAAAMTVNSAAMHIADAVGTPQAVLYSGTDLASQWCPRQAPFTLLTRPTACSPCYRITCPYRMECLDVPAREVADALCALASTQPARAAAPMEEGADA